MIVHGTRRGDFQADGSERVRTIVQDHGGDHAGTRDHANSDLGPRSRVASQSRVAGGLEEIGDSRVSREVWLRMILTPLSSRGELSQPFWRFPVVK